MGLSNNRLADVATQLGSQYLGNHNLQQREVELTLAGASLAHYHGHVSFRASDPMESALCLDDTAYRAGSPDANGHFKGQRLSANAMFDLRLSQPALVTVISCQSGESVVKEGDNLLGIPTALQSAGATAIISSLWKLDDEDGAAFAEAFYSELLRDSKGAQELDKTSAPLDNMMNLAVAIQTVVSKLMDGVGGEELAPYHWAPFVLHGFWMFPKVDKVNKIPFSFQAIN